MRGRAGKLPVLDFLGARPLRLALPLAVGVDEGIGEDTEQPRLQVGAVLVLMEGAIRLRERLLHQVLGVSRIARHPHRRRIQLIQVRQDITFEALVAPLERLSYRTHPLRHAWLAQTMLPAVSGGEYRAGCFPRSHGYPNIT